MKSVMVAASSSLVTCKEEIDRIVLGCVGVKGVATRRVANTKVSLNKSFEEFMTTFQAMLSLCRSRNKEREIESVVG